MSVLHFKHFIEGRTVTLFTDHKPLESSFKSKQLAKSDKQQRYLSILTEYISDIKYIRGQDNVVADCLSRSIQSVNIDSCDLSEIVGKQAIDNEIKLYSDKLTIFPFNDHSNLYCDTSTPYPRPFIPKCLRTSIFNEYHNLSHPGVKGTLKLIKSRFFWPNIDKDIRILCRECLACQQSKINRHTRTPTLHFDIPSERFQTVHIDVVGPLIPVMQHGQNFTSPCRYLLTCIDRATRWVEAAPMADISAATIAATFFNIWISRFGVPLHVVTDRGSQFESELFRELSVITGFTRLRTTAYHPQMNGIVERMHRSLKTSITARKQSWLDSLPVVLLSLRSIPNDNNISPFAAVTGFNFSLPQIIVDNSSKTLECNSHYIKQLFKEMSNLNFSDLSLGHHHSTPKTYMPKDLGSSTHVWLRTDRVRKPLEAPFTGPYPVLKRRPKHFTIRLHTGEEQTVSVDRLKPAYLPQPALTEQDGDSTTTPGDSTATPGDSTASPGDSTASPGDSTTTPGDSTTSPGDSTTTPGDSTTSPGDSTLHLVLQLHLVILVLHLYLMYYLQLLKEELSSLRRNKTTFIIKHN